MLLLEAVTNVDHLICAIFFLFLFIQPRQKQIEIDQLGYELTSQRRRHEVEVTGLRSRVSDLEQQLSESRREADEFHRQSLERNQELVALGNQVCVVFFGLYI